MVKADPTPTIDVTTAAKLLMLTPDRITQLVRAGHIKRAARGRYAVVDVVQGYIKFLKDEERKGSKTATQSRMQDAKTEEIEMRLAERRRELISTEDVFAAMSIMIAKFRDELAGLPARFTRDMDLRRKLEAETDDSQNRLAEAFAATADFLKEGGELLGHANV